MVVVVVDVFIAVAVVVVVAIVVVVVVVAIVVVVMNGVIPVAVDSIHGNSRGGEYVSMHTTTRTMMLKM